MHCGCSPLERRDALEEPEDAERPEQPQLDDELELQSGKGEGEEVVTEGSEGGREPQWLCTGTRGHCAVLLPSVGVRIQSASRMRPYSRTVCPYSFPKCAPSLAPRPSGVGIGRERSQNRRVADRQVPVFARVCPHARVCACVVVHVCVHLRMRACVCTDSKPGMSVSTDASTIRKSKTFHADVQNSLNLQPTPTTRCNKTRQRAATKPDKALQQNPTTRRNESATPAAAGRPAAAAPPPSAASAGRQTAERASGVRRPCS